VIGKHAERVALRKLGAVPDGFEFFSFRVIGEDAIHLQGGVCRPLKSGPRKGQRTWKGCKVLEVIVTDAETEAESARWSAETGKCAECLGESKVWAGWSAAHGHRFRPCPMCQKSASMSLLDRELAEIAGDA
jgi:hypothetical protein